MPKRKPRTSERPNVRASERPSVRTSRPSKRPNIRTSERPNIRTSERPNVRTSELPKLIRRRSNLHGFGVFAAEPISKNTRIIDYAGELIRNGRSCHRREAKYLKEGCLWVFRVNRAWSRDAAVGGNVARFINHSCTPNCWIEIADKTIWIRASRTIRRGEELLYDYSTVGDHTIQCVCRPGCKTRL